MNEKLFKIIEDRRDDLTALTADLIRFPPSTRRATPTGRAPNTSPPG